MVWCFVLCIVVCRRERERERERNHSVLDGMVTVYRLDE
jgi:hypothetical protein